MTHTFIAMRGYNHREPGVLGCALDDQRVNCELICDLHHVSAPAIRLAVKAKGVENITMISDSSKFCGMGDGDYVVGNHTMIL
jgi:N-acetylglucosamine-6-phosphate deacetylase